MLQNEDVGDIEKSDGIRSLTFDIDEFLGLFLHPLHIYALKISIN